MRTASILLALSSVCVCRAGAEEPVYFADSNLKTAVEDRLWVSDPTPADMLGLTRLMAVMAGIVDLTGLEHATNLQTLILRNNRISDLSPLSGLTNLEELWINVNQISDLSPLSGLVNLRKLLLHDNWLSDLSPLSDLTNLEFLDCRYNQVSDVSALSGLTRLHYVDAFNNQISDVSPLLGLPSLTELELRSNPLNDQAYCSHLPTIVDNNPGIDLRYSFNRTAPAGVTASDGAFPDRVRVTWEAVCNGPSYTGRYYRVFRALSPDGPKDAISEWHTSLSFDDVTPEPGAKYTYWVRTAVSSHGGSAGDYSAPDTGWFLPGFVPAPVPGRILYVDDDADGLNDGSCWADAFNGLADALAAAGSADTPVEVRVAQGMYRPDQGEGLVPGDHWASFHLVNHVTVKGGYAGLAQDDPNARDSDLYRTILSGDLNGDDIAVNDVPDVDDAVDRADNRWRVVDASYTDPSAILDGVTITGGYCAAMFRNGPGPVGGAGMLNRAGSPTLINCTFAGNAYVYGGGGGMFNYEGSTPTLVDCAFINNYGGGGGGGMDNLDSNPVLMDCRFEGNYAGAMRNRNSNPVLFGCGFFDNTGSGMSNYASSPELTRCAFRRNTAGAGGGMYNEEGSCPTLTSCVFSGNLAMSYGGAMENGDDCAAVLVNCLFSGNRAERGGALFNRRYTAWASVHNCSFVGNSAKEGSAIYAYGEVELSNSICWGDGEAGVKGSVTIRYSDIQGGWPGEGNIDVDPCFADPGFWNADGAPDDPNDDLWVEGDYHLKSQAGRWDPAGRTWVCDDLTSPCIDAGDPDHPVGDEPLPNGGILNMGAYGGTAEASQSKGAP